MSNNDHNPMKKRFRSWQPASDEPPRRRRRYPRLIVRDGTGKYIANDIATAPKVEIPRIPLFPKSVMIPTSSVSHPDPHAEHNSSEQPASRLAETSTDSPECSTNTRDHGTQEVDSQRSLPSPSSPLLVKSTAVNDSENVVSRIASCQPAFHTSSQPDISPQRHAHALVAAAPANPSPGYAQGEYPSPQYNLRPRTVTGSYTLYDTSSYTPRHPGGSVVTAAQRRAPYPVQLVGHAALKQSGQYIPHIIQSNLSNVTRSNVYQSQISGYNGPPLAPTQVDSYPSGNTQSEKIILAGKRCGTVDYWRSSLQMPRHKGVVKSLKAPAPQAKRRVKQEGGPAGHSTYTPQPPHSDEVSPRLSSGFAPTNAPQRAVQSTDYDAQSRPDQNPRQADQSTKRCGSEIEHKFWRTSTKLPRASSETTRVKRLAHGKRRIDGAYIDSPCEAGTGRSTQDAMVKGSSPVSGCFGDGQQAESANAGVQTDCAQQPVPMPVTSQAGIPMAEPSVQQQHQQQGISGSAKRTKAQSESRRLLFLRDFEMRRLRTLAQSKFHVKMNLRGRIKLEQWICADEVTIAAADVIVTMFNFDRRVLSKNEEVRRNALSKMANGDLRILEALMSRICSRGGRTNWALLTSSLSLENFITPPPTESL